VTATNAIGTGPASAPSSRFVVGSPPGPPANVLAIPGRATTASGPLVVSFSPGAASGGSPVTSYRARCTSLNGGDAGSRSGPRAPIAVGGLTTGKTYLCTVAAVNGSGAGVDSSPARATVGAPAPPRVLRTLPLAHGIAFPFVPPADNGSAITEYRSRCFSGNSAVRISPPEPRSPLIATNLVDGQSYICAVTARNARGVGPETISGPIKVGRPPVSALATCSGQTGSVGVRPGLATSPARSQTFSLSSTLSQCGGPYVRAASLSISVRSSTALMCRNAINVNSTGSGTIRWTTPGGMGKSSLTLRFVITSTSGHETKAHVYGQVTTTVNMFTGSHVSGDLTLDRGLAASSAGGDCSASPLTHFGVTAIKLRFS
jgi:hypothetical protein